MHIQMPLTLKKNISFTESDLPVFSDDPTINHQYFESIITLETTGYLPDGEFIYDINDQYYYNYKEIAYSDKVAVYDINNDGKNELLIKIGGTGYSDNNLYVFSYNFNENFELLFRIPARETFFDNSIVKIDDYKTQYKQYYEEFYPYSCLIINSTEITIFAHVEQLFLTDNNDIPGFPNDCDLNNNNVVYKIVYNNDYSNFEYLDDADYYEWKKEHLSKPQNIQFYPIS